MTNQLKPCPFCGGEYTQVRFMGLKGYPSAFENGYRGECCDCGAITRAFRTETGAANFWNTRAERTCRMETEESCQNWNSCSECHADYYTDQPISYCPNCGARVVE